MTTPHDLPSILRSWSTILGSRPAIGAALPGRELWPVTAEDDRSYLLKRLGPWRNLPVADQARVLRHLSHGGIRVAEFLITDDVRLVAGADRDSFVLLPRLPHDALTPAQATAVEEEVGREVAGLHRALAAYPWDAHSYREDIVGGLKDLVVPADIAERFAARRGEVLDRIAALPTQLVHGDLTPGNVLVSRAARSVAFIDLDHLPLAPRLWDVAKYLSRRLRHLPPARAAQHITAVVRGYHRASPLSGEEITALPALVLAMDLLEASWTARIFAGRLERRLLPEQRADLDPTLAALRRLLDDDRFLTAAIAAGTT